MINIEIEAQDSVSSARVCRFLLNGQEVKTPLFMPVGTLATVKTLDSEELEEIGFPIILANTYHLCLRPGEKVVENSGGIHSFMAFKNRVLTDSGGFQIFSLSGMRKVDDQGVDFRSVYDGSLHRFTPERVIDIQRSLGSDIMMVLDECPPGDADRKIVQRSLERTHRWAAECRHYFDKERRNQHLFGIIQGGGFEDLRLDSQREIQSLGFDGIAIGGLSVGESLAVRRRVLQALAPGYQKKSIRYLMGIGTPEDFLLGVENGVDIFDCVMPTRVARHGKVYTFEGTLNMYNACHINDSSPLAESCECRVCKRYSRGYIHHLFRSKEFLAQRLASYHNLFFFHQFMSDMRRAIYEGQFSSFRDSFLDNYHPKSQNP